MKHISPKYSFRRKAAQAERERERERERVRRQEQWFGGGVVIHSHPTSSSHSGFLADCLVHISLGKLIMFPHRTGHVQFPQ